MKYDSSKHKGEYCRQIVSYTTLHIILGKNVFKKAVKLTVSVVPTQACSNQAAPTDTAESGETIVFDGRTFTVTFSQNSGE